MTPSIIVAGKEVCGGRCWAGRCPVPQGFVPHPYIPANGGAGKRASSSQKTSFVFLLLPPGTAMRKRMVKNLSNSGLGKGGKFPPRSSLTFMPVSSQSWLCPWASPGCAATPRLSWVTPGPPVQQQGGESLGQSESLGADFHGLFIFQVFWCVGCNYSSTSEAKQEQKSSNHFKERL